jgi:hypothetical protein
VRPEIPRRTSGGACWATANPIASVKPIAAEALRPSYHREASSTSWRASSRNSRFGVTASSKPDASAGLSPRNCCGLTRIETFEPSPNLLAPRRVHFCLANRQAVHDLLTAHGWESDKNVIERFAGVKMIQQCLNGDSCTGEDCRPARDAQISRDHAIERLRQIVHLSTLQESRARHLVSRPACRTRHVCRSRTTRVRPVPQRRVRGS